MTRYEILSERSSATIDARSSVGPIHWTATGLEGHFDAPLGEDGRLTSDGEVAGRLEVAVEQLKSGNPLYDSELLRRVDARRYPTIVGELRLLRRLDGRFEMGGDLSFHGVTRPVTGEVEISSTLEGALVIEGEQGFDIRDYDMTAPRVLGMQIYPDFTVRIRLEAAETGR
jgi:polyisoprenoid-binding protein YceI